MWLGILTIFKYGVKEKFNFSILVVEFCFYCYFGDINV